MLVLELSKLSRALRSSNRDPWPYIYSVVFQPQCYWYLGPDNSLLRDWCVSISSCCVCVCVCVCARARVHTHMFSHSVMSNSFATSWTLAHQAPLSMGFSRQKYWSRLPFPSPGDLLDPGIEPTPLVPLVYHCATWEAPSFYTGDANSKIPVVTAKKCLQRLPSVPWGARWRWWRTTDPEPCSLKRGSITSKSTVTESL